MHEFQYTKLSVVVCVRYLCLVNAAHAVECVGRVLPGNAHLVDRVLVEVRKDYLAAYISSCIIPNAASICARMMFHACAGSRMGNGRPSVLWAAINLADGFG